MNSLKIWLNSLFRLPIPEETILKEIYNECTKSLSSAYSNKNVIMFIQSMPTKTLLGKAVQIYVGSQSCPKNQYVSEFFLKTAQEKAKGNKEQQMLVKYYRAYLQKLQSVSLGNEGLFERSSEDILQLAEKGHPLSCAYKVAESINEAERINEKEEMLLESLQMFYKSLSPQQYQGIYFIGSILESLPLSKFDKQIIQQIYTIAAGLGSPLALLKLAFIYKARKDTRYIHYLKQSAELGIIQAQHNLGVQYLRGQILQKDQLKAFGWFVHSAAHNFTYSKYNASMLLLKGSECGRIKPNKKAALVFLEDIHRSGQIDVSDKIKSILEDKQFQQESTKSQNDII